MPNFTASVAAATAVVGYDIFINEVWKRSPYPRRLMGLGCMGSAAAGDTEIEILIDEVRIMSIFNQGTGFPNNDTLMPMEGNYIPAGAELRGIVRDAPATNPINAMVALENA